MILFGLGHELISVTNVFLSRIEGIQLSYFCLLSFHLAFIHFIQKREMRLKKCSIINNMNETFYTHEKYLLLTDLFDHNLTLTWYKAGFQNLSELALSNLTYIHNTSYPKPNELSPVHSHRGCEGAFAPSHALDIGNPATPPT